MTYAASVEIILHLNQFTISDEYSEGIYKLRSSIYYEKPVQVEDMEGKKSNTFEVKVVI